MQGMPHAESNLSTTNCMLNSHAFSAVYGCHVTHCSCILLVCPFIDQSERKLSNIPWALKILGHVLCLHFIDQLATTSLSEQL